MAVLALLAVLELGARLLAPAPTTPDGSADGIYDGHVYSERLGWKPRPGARFTVAGALTTIDARGFRGQAAPADPGPARTRVLLLGDSVTFGYGVADEQTFASLLGAERGGFEVANLAVPGYGVDQSLRRYELVGRLWRPQVVVLNLCVHNDLADIMLPVFLYDGQHPKPYFTLTGGELELHDEHLQLGWLARLRLRLSERSVLYRHLARRPLAEEPAGPTEHWTERRRKAVLDGAAAEELMVALLLRLRREVESDGARLVLAFHPSKASYRGEVDWPERVARRAGLADLQVVSLAERYRAARLPFAAIALDGIGHLSPQGHRLAAHVLSAAIESWPATP